MRTFAIVCSMAVVACGGSSAPEASPGVFFNGCGGNSAPNAGPGTGAPAVQHAVAFEVNNAVFTRFSSICGVPNPPFTAGDVYELDLVTASFDAVSLNFFSTIPVGRDLSVRLRPFGAISCTLGPGGQPTEIRNGQQGSIDAANVGFAWTQGFSPNAVDAQAVASATVHFSSLPKADGDPLGVRITVVFEDGGVLDLTPTVTLQTSAGPCSHP
jgi:hypothetical protein